MAKYRKNSKRCHATDDCMDTAIATALHLEAFGPKPLFGGKKHYGTQYCHHHLNLLYVQRYAYRMGHDRLYAINELKVY